MTPIDIKPVEILGSNSVKQAKKNDVINLLTKHFGENWREDDRLSFFIHVINGGAEEDEDVDEPCQGSVESPQFVV